MNLPDQLCADLLALLDSAALQLETYPDPPQGGNEYQHWLAKNIRLRMEELRSLK